MRVGILSDPGSWGAATRVIADREARQRRSRPLAEARRMGLRVAASSDARALAIRDHVLPLVREHGTLEDLEGKDSTLRLIVLEQDPWCLIHWTPFNALAPAEASSPGYRHALERQRRRPALWAGNPVRTGQGVQHALGRRRDIRSRGLRPWRLGGPSLDAVSHSGSECAFSPGSGYVCHQAT